MRSVFAGWTKSERTKGGTGSVVEPVAFETPKDQLMGSALPETPGTVADPVACETPNDQAMGSASPVKTVCTLKTAEVRLLLSVSLVPSTAFVPVPLAVTVSEIVTRLLKLTEGLVQVGDSAVASSSVPPVTDQA